VDIDKYELSHKRQQNGISKAAFYVRVPASLCLSSSKRCFTNRGWISLRHLLSSCRRPERQSSLQAAHGAAILLRVRALNENISPRGNVQLGDESLPATRLHCWRAEKRVVREKVKESCRDQLSLATYQQAKTRAEGLQEQQRGE
jgi:hypothetical protein